MSEMKTSEVLDLSADIVEQRGWITGVWNNTQTDAPVCLEGGIAAALGIEVDLGAGGTNEEYESFQQCPAYRAVQEYLEHDDDLYVWNDACIYEGEQAIRARSQAQVVEVLRAAAAVERAKEESLERSAVTA